MVLAPEPHPAQRMRVSGRIQAGVPLKAILGRQTILLLAESFQAVVPGFPAAGFRAAANRGLEPMALLARGAHIADRLAAHLPADFAEAAPLLIAAMGPVLTATEGNGLAPFFYLPHSHFIATRGVGSFASGMHANYELTRRFTAEYSLRPYLIAHPGACLAELARWAVDADPHVRRAASEATRPRLPWAMRLPAFQVDPTPVLPLLETLKDDPVLYVRRSVANHLGDILKDHPSVVHAICRRWIDEISAAGFDPAIADNRRWMIRHAVRLPAKQGERTALALRVAAKAGAQRTNGRGRSAG